MRRGGVVMWAAQLSRGSASAHHRNKDLKPSCCQSELAKIFWQWFPMAPGVLVSMETPPAERDGGQLSSNHTQYDLVLSHLKMVAMDAILWYHRTTANERRGVEEDRAPWFEVGGSRVWISLTAKAGFPHHVFIHRIISYFYSDFINHKLDNWYSTDSRIKSHPR